MVSTDRRQLLTLVASTGGIALAGCSGGDSDGDSGDSSGSDDGGGDGGSDGSDDGSGNEIEDMCTLADGNVEELSVVGCTSEIEDGDFLVSLTIRNDGGEQINLFAYSLFVLAYTSTDRATENRLTSGGQVTYGDGATSLPADGTVDVTVMQSPNDASPEDIQMYVVELTCGTSNEGVYCEGTGN